MILLIDNYDSFTYNLVQVIGTIHPDIQVVRNDAVTLEEIAAKKDEDEAIGIEAIRACKVGAVLLAGGQGTRLGLDKPKGMLNVGINKELYLFEQLINNLMIVVKKADAWVPLFIMTSEKNHQDTTQFFEEHNYFGYNSDYIFFFVQEMAPSVS